MIESMPGINASFSSRFAALRQSRGPFCLGVDPSPSLLAGWGLGDDLAGLRAFCERVMAGVGEEAAVIKPQVAYFERFGGAGLLVLKELIARIQAQGALCLMDCKRGDIGSTSEAYGDAWLGRASAMGADAMTLHPYLGVGGLRPIAAIVHARRCHAFVMTASSNPEGWQLQRARLDDGRMVAELVADEIAETNRSLSPEVPVLGAVIGATVSGAGELAARIPGALILAPGIGAQGGDYPEASAAFGEARDRAIPVVARAVLSEGPDPVRLATAVRRHAEAAGRWFA